VAEAEAPARVEEPPAHPDDRDPAEKRDPLRNAFVADFPEEEREPDGEHDADVRDRHGESEQQRVAEPPVGPDEVGRDGILVNNVCPGSILTERMVSNVTARAKELGIPLEEALAQRAAETAVGRIGDPREMAYLVAFLASGKAAYITGTTILVDGGLVRSVL